MKKTKPVKVLIEVDRTQVDRAIGRVDELAKKLNVVANTMKEVEGNPFFECFEKVRGDFWHETAIKSLRVAGWLGGAILGIIIAKFL